jgi:hypothetical protein
MALAKYYSENSEQRKGSAVSVNFYPNRKKMSREIGVCIVLKRRDVLESFCSSCIFRIFENAAVRECFSCEVRQAMNVIVQENKKNTMPSDQGALESNTGSSRSFVSDRKESMSDSGEFMARLMSYSKAMVLSAVFLLFVLFGSVSASLAAAPEGATLVRSASSSDVVKILSVMESRTTDRSILDKAAGKLNAMEGRSLRILSKLSDRIAEDADAAGADIAFSLMTMMIVLS